MSPRPLTHNTQHPLISCHHLLERSQRVVERSPEYIDEKISFCKGASHKQAPLLMKDSRSDCLAVRQIKLQHWVGGPTRNSTVFTRGDESAFITTQKTGSEEQMTFNEPWGALQACRGTESVGDLMGDRQYNESGRGFHTVSTDWLRRF